MTSTSPEPQARVIEEHKTNYIIRIGEEELTATVRGKFHLKENGTTDFPKVGDFVEFSRTSDGLAVIENILPRKTEVIRQSAGGDDQQVLVTNVDVMLITMGLDNDFSLRRLERYLLLAEQSQIQPVIILNKSDRVDNATDYERQVREIAPTVDIEVVSAKTGTGMESILQYFTNDITAVLLGSSGAGKSTITNWLLQSDTQEVKAIREYDGRGRHTTTSRQLFALPRGGYLIDTPGMRELAVIDTPEDTMDVFADIEALALQCRYPGCDHIKSEGCAVQAALKAGDIDAKHFEGYLKLMNKQSSKKDSYNIKQRKKRTS